MFHQLNRRRFLQAAAAGLCVPSLGSAATSSERKFLFVFCDGGWDPTMVFAPLLDNPHIYREPQAVETMIEGMPLVDSPHRPRVRQFFEQWGSECLIINGIDFETVAHDRGKRLLMTGGVGGSDDWGAIISSQAEQLYTAPYLVLSGPTYTSLYSNAVVRVGDRGQLYKLLHASDQLAGSANVDAEDLVQQYLQQRQHSWTATTPHRRRFARNYQDSHQQLENMLARLDGLSLMSNNEQQNLGCTSTFMVEARTALELFEQGLTRCAIVEDHGFCQMRWDSHADIYEQNWHYDLLFEGLMELMNELHQRYAPSGALLADEVTVVVCSELGRHPQINEIGGKHHWPVTSAMLIGGVTGGRVVGGFDQQFLSVPVDLQSAEASATGEKLMPEHLGATLLALADIDYGAYTSATPLLGVLA